MAGPAVSYEYPRRASMRRRALTFALAGYLALFAAGLVALAGLVIGVGPAAMVVSLVGGGLIAAATLCWGIDRLAFRRMPRYQPFAEITLRSVASRPR